MDATTPLSPAEAEREQYLKRLGSDFSFFLQELWKETGLQRVHPVTRVEIDMAKWAQHGPFKRGILGARGIGKSYIITAAFTAFRLFRDPERKILFTSANGGLMREVIQELKNWFASVWFLRHLAPRPRLERAHQKAFDVPGAKNRKVPSVKAIGIRSGTGSRGHTIIADDIETKDNTQTVDTRATLALFATDLDNILYPDLALVEDDPTIIPAIDPPEILVVGTIKPDFGSVYNTMEEQGYVFRTYPMVYPDVNDVKAARTITPLLLKDLEQGKAKPGDPVFPRRFPAELIEKKRYGAVSPTTGVRVGGMPDSEWLKEYMLYRDLSLTMPFKLLLRNLMVMHVDRDTAPIHVVYGQHNEHGTTEVTDIRSLGHGTDRFYRPAHVESVRAPYAGTKAWIDPAGGGEDGVGVAIVGHLGGFFHVKGLYEIDGGYDPVTCLKVAELLRFHGAKEVYCEYNLGAGMFEVVFAQYLQKLFLKPGEDPLYPDGWTCAIVADPKITHVYGIKEVRIVDSLEMFTSQHRVIIDYEVAKSFTFQNQYCNIRPVKGCLAKSPNMIDALSGCFLAWKYALALDPVKQFAKMTHDPEAETFKQIEDFLFGNGKRKAPAANWLRPRG